MVGLSVYITHIRTIMEHISYLLGYCNLESRLLTLSSQLLLKLPVAYVYHTIRQIITTGTVTSAIAFEIPVMTCGRAY